MGRGGLEVAILFYLFIKKWRGLGAWYKTFVPAVDMVDMVGAAMLVRSFLETHTKKKKKKKAYYNALLSLNPFSRLSSFPPFLCPSMHI